jgi:hypothetical protein
MRWHYQSGVRSAMNHTPDAAASEVSLAICCSRIFAPQAFCVWQPGSGATSTPSAATTPETSPDGAVQGGRMEYVAGERRDTTHIRVITNV